MLPRRLVRMLDVLADGIIRGHKIVGQWFTETQSPTADIDLYLLVTALLILTLLASIFLYLI